MIIMIILYNKYINNNRNNKGNYYISINILLMIKLSILYLDNKKIVYN